MEYFPSQTIPFWKVKQFEMEQKFVSALNNTVSVLLLSC